MARKRLEAPEYWYRDRVWLRARGEPDKGSGIVHSIWYPGYARPIYTVTWSDGGESRHYGAELTDTEWTDGDDEDEHETAPEPVEGPPGEDE